MHVLLMTPPYPKQLYREGQSLGISYIASFLLKNKINVDVIEPSQEDLSESELFQMLKNKKYMICGISLQFDFILDKSICFIKKLKKYFNFKIFIGGVSATFHYKILLEQCKEIDAVILNEGEITFYEICKAIFDQSDWHKIHNIAYMENDLIFKNIGNPFIDNLDKLPFPLRNIKNKDQVAIITSRGCLFNCSFCSASAYYKQSKPQWRYRSPKNIVDELEEIFNNYGINTFSFTDDNFTGGSKEGIQRVYKIADEISNRNLQILWSFGCRVQDVEIKLFNHLKKVGLKHVFIGIENGSQNVLDRYRKKTSIKDNINAIDILKNLNILTDYYYISFDPYTTINELKESFLFLKNNKIANYKILTSKMIPYKGSDVFKKLEKQKLLKIYKFNYTYGFQNKDIKCIYNTLQNCFSVFKYIDNTFRSLIFTTRNYDYYNNINYIREYYSDYLMTNVMSLINTIEQGKICKSYIDDQRKKSIEFSHTIIDKIECL